MLVAQKRLNFTFPPTLSALFYFIKLSFKYFRVSKEIISHEINKTLNHNAHWIEKNYFVNTIQICIIIVIGAVLNVFGRSQY